MLLKILNHIKNLLIIKKLLRNILNMMYTLYLRLLSKLEMNSYLYLIIKLIFYVLELLVKFLFNIIIKNITKIIKNNNIFLITYN